MLLSDEDESPDDPLLGLTVLRAVAVTVTRTRTRTLTVFVGAGRGLAVTVAVAVAVGATVAVTVGRALTFALAWSTSTWLPNAAIMAPIQKATNAIATDPIQTRLRLDKGRVSTGRGCGG